MVDLVGFFGVPQGLRFVVFTVCRERDGRRRGERERQKGGGQRQRQKERGDRKGGGRGGGRAIDR